MTDFVIIMSLMGLTAFMAFIAGFAFCQWGHIEKAKQERQNLIEGWQKRSNEGARIMWEAIEWD